MPAPGSLTGGSFNVGRDLTIAIVVNGVTYNTLGLLTDTGRKSISNMHEVVPTNNDGVPVRRTTYGGYEFDFHLTRQSGVLENLIQALQQNYFSGGVPPTVTMTETIRNPDQSANQTTYTGGTIVPDSLGSFKGADAVNDITLKVTFSQANDITGSASVAPSLLSASAL